MLVDAAIRETRSRLWAAMRASAKHGATKNLNKNVGPMTEREARSSGV